jgi:hypothetical protein
MELKCERIIHGVRHGRLVKDKETGELKRVGQSINHPYRCDRPALKIQVEGDSFATFAVLCKMHRQAARREGFKLPDEILAENLEKVGAL